MDGFTEQHDETLKLLLFCATLQAFIQARIAIGDDQDPPTAVGNCMIDDAIEVCAARGFAPSFGDFAQITLDDQSGAGEGSCT
jgi:hypothetical protein